MLACVGLVGRPARADDSHYQDFVVGGRSMGLGGAFTAIANDPSGVYYNPAGIADVREESYQISTSLYGFERGGYGGGDLVLPVAGLESLNVRFTDLVIVPASAGLVQTFGGKGPDGQPLMAYAFTVVVPSFRSFNAQNAHGTTFGDTSDLVTERQPSYVRRVTDRSLWAGAAFGRRVNDRLRLGISGFYVLRSTEDVESLSLSADIRDSDADPSNDSQVFRIARNDIELLNGSVLFIAGAKLKVTDELTLGLTAQSPSIPVHSTATLQFETGESVPSCESLHLDAETLALCQKDPLLSQPRSHFDAVTVHGESETAQPAALRLGAAYVVRYKLTATADLSVHLPTSYQLIKSSELTEELRARIPFNPKIDRLPVINVNVGVEYLIIREVSVAAGFYTDFSSAGAVGRRPRADTQPNVDLRGLTLTLGYFGKHSLSRVGILYSWGDGFDVIPTSDVGRLVRHEESFQRVAYFQSFFYVFLSSTFRY